jgi:hypothetical protein
MILPRGVREQFRLSDQQRKRRLVLRESRLTMIDRHLWQEHLAQAERHVAEAEQHIARQRHLVADLERHGHDTESACYLMRQFEEMLAVHVLHRDRLRGELEDDLDHADATP